MFKAYVEYQLKGEWGIANFGTVAGAKSYAKKVEKKGGRVIEIGKY